MKQHQQHIHVLQLKDEDGTKAILKPGENWIQISQCRYGGSGSSSLKFQLRHSIIDENVNDDDDENCCICIDVDETSNIATIKDHSRVDGCKDKDKDRDKDGSSSTSTLCFRLFKRAARASPFDEIARRRMRLLNHRDVVRLASEEFVFVEFEYQNHYQDDDGPHYCNNNELLLNVDVNVNVGAVNDADAGTTNHHVHAHAHAHRDDTDSNTLNTVFLTANSAASDVEEDVAIDADADTDTREEEDDDDGGGLTQKYIPGEDEEDDDDSSSATASLPDDYHHDAAHHPNHSSRDQQHLVLDDDNDEVKGEESAIADAKNNRCESTATSSATIMSCRVDNGESCSMETVCASNCSPKKQQQKNPAMNNLKEGEDVLKIDAKMESNSKEALDKVEPTNNDDSSLLVPSTSSFNPNAACTVPAAHTGDSFSSSSSLNKGSDDVDLHAQWPKNSGEKHECEILPERSGVLQAVSTCSTNKKVKGKDEHKSDKKLLAVAAANALSIVDDQADSTIGERTGVDETCNESSAGGAASDQSESLGDANAEKNGDKCSKQVYGSKIQSPSISKCAKNRDLNVKEMPYTKEAGIEALEVGQNGTQDILVSLMEQETTPAPKPKRSKRRRATSPITPPMPDSNGSYTILTPIATENAGGHRSWHSSARSTRSAISSAVEPTATVLFTGVEVSDKHKKMVRSIGASLIESIDDAASATHVIAGDTKNSLRRTPKLMVALCVTPNILHLNWLNESFKAGEVLKCNKYLLLKDKAAEKKYNFSMKTTIKNGSEAREKGGIFADMYVYFCKGVAGNKAPSIKELEIMVSSAGGTFLKVLPKNNVDTKMILIITSDPATEAQKREKLVMKIIEGGGHLVSTAWLFQCMIAQEFMAFPVDSDNMNSLPRENVRKKKRTIDGDISEDGDRSHTRRKTRRR